MKWTLRTSQATLLVAKVREENIKGETAALSWAKGLSKPYPRLLTLETGMKTGLFTVMKHTVMCYPAKESMYPMPPFMGHRLVMKGLV